jgi:predicted transcriptional regulator
MADAQHILISLEPRHAENIMSGRKRVELRKRPMNIHIGTTVWIYAKLPVGSVVGKAMVSEVHAATPASIWRRFGKDTGVTKQEFSAYYGSSTQAVVLVLGEPRRFEKAISLDHLRKTTGSFHPPQFFTRLFPEHPVFKAMKRAA